MAWGGGRAGRGRTGATAACRGGTISRSPVSGRAMSCGVCAHANAPTSISRSRDDPSQHLVEHLVGQRAHLVARERLDRVLHHHGAVAGGSERLRLRLRGARELGGDDRRRRNAMVLEEHAVVHTARCAGPSVGERLDEHVGALHDLIAERIGRGPREGRLLLAHDRLGGRTLAQQLLDAVEQVIAFRLGDVEQRDHLPVETRGPRRGLAGHRDGVGRVEILGHRILLITRLLPLENVQPGTMAEKRPAVPPATSTLMCSGARNFGIGVTSCSGSANLRSTCSGRPSPPFSPGTSSRTGRCSRSNRKRRTSAFDHPSPATIAACSGESSSSVSPQWVILWCSITAMLAATVASTSGAVRLRWSYTVRGASAASSATVSSVAAKPCSTANDSHGLASSRSPMQYV